MKKTAIIGAMIEEIEAYKTGISNIVQLKKANITFYQGIMNGKPIILCQSGVGKVNAAVCTQILIDVFEVNQIIFTGVAGALHPELDIGDIVISSAAKQHDIDASPLGFEKGVIPYADQSIFEADKTLISLAHEASKQSSKGRTEIGLILSGDQFIAGGDQAQKLYEEHKGYCTEMEGAAVAQVCDMNGIPFVIVRSMSDKADGSAHLNFAEFTKLAAEKSFIIVNKMLEMM